MVKGDAKFKGKLICGLAKDIRNLVDFDTSSRKSQNLLFHQILSPKHMQIQMKQYRRVSLMTLKNDAKFEEGLPLGSKNDMDEFYDASSGKSENFHFDRLLLWKVCNL